MIETDRLVLRRQTADDAPFILRLLNDPDFLRFIGDRGVRTLAEAEAYIDNGAVASYEAHGFGLYLVEARATGEPIGVCGFVKRDFLDDVDLGFAFLPEHRRRGYAREAAEATIAYGRAELGLGRIVAVVAPENIASAGLLDGLGFRACGRTKHPDGGISDLYALDLTP